VRVVGAGIVEVEIEIGDGDEQRWSRAIARGDSGRGVELKLGDADVVLDEKDLFGAAVEDFEAAILVVVCTRVAEFFVLQEFDDDAAEGLVGEVAGSVREGGGEKAGVAVGQGHGDGIFALYHVYDFGGPQIDIDVVVTVPVHEGFRVRRNFDVEDADVIVGEHQVVMGLGGDFDFGLDGQEGGEGEEDGETAHGGDFNSRD